LKSESQVDCFLISDAKVRIIFETTKLFGKFF